MKTILFDLDGTITDSGEGIINSALFALEHFGLPLPDREAMRVFVGPPLHETFVKFGVPEEKAEEAVAVYRKRYIPTGMFENAPYPGVEKLLIDLKAHGHNLLIATSKPEWIAIDILKHFGLDPYFDTICGATMDTSRTSKDAVIGYLLEKNGTTEDMLMVGDTEFDVLGAAKHNIPCIGVSWGYGSTESMISAGAVAVAHTMQELFEYLNK